MAQTGRGAGEIGEIRAYAYLTLAFLFMALNVIVGRAAHEEIAPFALSFWRWTLASALFAPFAIAKIREQRALIRRHWKALAVIALVMVPAGNNLIYVGLAESTALNGGLIAAARPAIILVIVAMIFRGPVGRAQWLGIAIALAGVVLVLTGGEPGALAGFAFNRGDLWLVAGSCGIAAYQVGVGRLPRAIHPTVLLQVTMVLGMAMMAPLYLWESAAIAPVVPTWPAIAAIVFVATLPSIGAVYLINAGIAAVGPARMGIFNYLQPLFVAAIAIPLLGERLAWYHPVALALVAGGIVISSRGRGLPPTG